MSPPPLELVPALLTILYGVAFVVVALRILAHRRPHGTAMAWLLFTLLVPGLGAVLYFMIGERRLGRRWIERAEAGRIRFARRYRELAGEAAVDPSRVGPVGEPAARLAAALVGIPVIGGHSVELLSDSDAILRSLIDDVEQCREWCSFEFYIWHEGGLVDALVDALVRAAARGVKVRAMMDGLGSRPFVASPAVRAMRTAGIDVLVVLPAAALRMVVARADLRDHRKIAVFDGEIAYTGSFNLADPRYFKREAGFGEWVDAMVRIRGPACATLAAISDAMAEVQQGLPVTGARAAPTPAPAGDVALQPYPSGPGFAYRHVESVILAALHAARSEISLTTPYFAPGESVITALRSAARRGVAVTVLLPLRCDSRLVRQASAAYFDELLAVGVRIQRFDGGLLHTKSLVIDRSVSVFGTLNFDLRSFHLNFELSVLIYDRDFAQRLLDLQRSYLAHCEPLDLAAWRARPYWQRIVENAAQLASPLL